MTVRGGRPGAVTQNTADQDGLNKGLSVVVS